MEYSQSMRLDLSQLNTRNLDLQLTPPRADEAERQFVRLLETNALSGVLESTEEGLRLSNASAQRAIMEALRLKFGSVVLELEGPTEILRALTEYATSGDGLDMNLVMGVVTCPRLTVEVGTIVASAGLELERGGVRISSDGGRIEVPNCTFRNFSLSLSGIRLSAPELSSRDLVISWGSNGFELRAHDLDSPSFELSLEGTTVRLEALRVTRLDVMESNWALSDLSTRSAWVVVEKARSDEAAGTSAANEERDEPDEERKVEDGQPRLPFVDWNMLDNIEGHVNVDLGVDLKVPVLQHRRAVHHFRVPIEAGKINFRSLEHNLATLEDMLLDFSVRQGELILEAGIPLLPTRGLGKRLVRWVLSAQEEEWAREHLVRLATLAQPEILLGKGKGAAADSDEAQEDNHESQSASADSEAQGGGSDVLQQLTLRNIDVELSVGGPLTLRDAMVQMLRVGSFTVTGDVIHRVEGEREKTHVQGTFADIEVSIDDLPLGGHKLDLRKFVLAGKSRFEAELENLEVSAANAQIGAVRAAFVGFGSFAEPGVDAGRG